MTKKIGFIVGSLREGSYNKLVAKKFASLLPEGFEASFIEIGNLPFYNEDLEVEGKVPAEWTAFREALSAVDGVFFFTPEYNRVSPGAIAGFGANHHLRQSLVFLDMPTLQQPEAYIGGITNLIDENNEINPDTVSFFETILAKYIEFFQRFN